MPRLPRVGLGGAVCYTVPGGGNQGDGIGFKYGWTKSNATWLGRLAMFGFAGSLVGEQLTGKGVLGQIGLETGIPVQEAEPLVLAFIAANWALVLLPSKGEFISRTMAGTKGGSAGDEEEDIFLDKNPPAQFGTMSSNDIAFGLLEQWSYKVGKKIGMSKENELLIGRIAQGGFAASILGEIVTGKGPLGQLGLEIGVGVNGVNPFPLLLAFILVVLALANGTGKWKGE